MLRHVFTFLFIVALCCGVHAGEVRQLTGSNGKIIEAEVLALEGDVVKIKLKSGREMNVLLSKFAEKDQELIKQITSTEDPFSEDGPATNQMEESPIQGPEVIRTVIEIDEQGNGKFRLEKTSEPPKDDFGGEKVVMPLLPKTPIKVKPDGLVKMIFDFEDADEPFLFTGWRYAIDRKAKELKLSVTDGKDDPNTPCLFGLPPGVVRLPMKILVDTKTFQRDIIDMEWLFCGEQGYLSLVSLKVFRNANNTFEFECQWENRDKKRGDTNSMRAVEKKINIKIDQPFEVSFKLPVPEDDLLCPIRFGLGRHLNARSDQKTDKSIVGYKRLELTGPLSINLGFHAEEYGGKLVFMRDLGYVKSQFGEKLGIQGHDEIRSINGVKVESAEDANKLLAPIKFCDDFAFEIVRHQTPRIIRVFKKGR